MRGVGFMRFHYPIAVAFVIPALVCAACGAPPAEAPAIEPKATAAPTAPPSGATGPLVVFLGDSLTAGYGLSESQAFPALIGERLRMKGIAARVVNAGVSGDTSAGGLRRLDWVLRQRPDVLVVGLGANDALRGQSVEEIERNLREIVRRARSAESVVVLLGMRIPTNYGDDYAEAFAALYPRLAKSESVALVPFLLEGVAGRDDLNLADGIHPNSRGQQIVAATVEPWVRRALR